MDKKILFDDEIFGEAGYSVAVPIIWWLVHLLGDQVTIPDNDEFWLDNFPMDTMLTMTKENGELKLRSTTLAKEVGDTIV